MNRTAVVIHVLRDQLEYKLWHRRSCSPSPHISINDSMLASVCYTVIYMVWLGLPILFVTLIQISGAVYSNWSC